jgi:hypothetical protein
MAVPIKRKSNKKTKLGKKGPRTPGKKVKLRRKGH